MKPQQQDEEDGLEKSQKSRNSSTVSQIVSEKGLVCVQLIVLLKLLFDLLQGGIGFFNLFVEDISCCGYEIDPFELRPLSLGQMIAGPYISLILLELLLLWRSVCSKKKRPSEGETSDEEDEQQKPKQSCCSRLRRFGGRAVLNLLNKICLLNPFFGCFIAWMLLYQSDKRECFIVLGLEFGSIVLHFIAVGLTETIRRWRHFLLPCIPLIPFIATVALVLIYMKQEGVCYIVEKALFHFQGCELCPDGYPPINGQCIDDDGRFFDFETHNIFDVGNWDSVTGKSAEQGSFCGGTAEDGKWNNTHFCFFPYQ